MFSIAVGGVSMDLRLNEIGSEVHDSDISLRLEWYSNDVQYGSQT